MNISDKIPLAIVAGPTASGKTALAIEIAKKTGGEIISADSMQIYRDMNIGTAKPTEEEMQGVPHHLIDIASPDENFSLGKYAALAHETIKDVYLRGRLPILCGGTGLYIDTVADNIKLTKVPADAVLRERLVRRAENEGAKSLLDELSEIDPKTAQKLHTNDVKRIIRALEIYYLTGETKSCCDEKSKKEKKIYNYLYFAIETERKILYNKINIRVDKMIDDGLFEEGKKLFEKYGFTDTTAMQGIAYREMRMYFRGLISFDETVNLIKRNSRRLAKRQITWFGKREGLIKIYADDTEKCVNLIKKELYPEGDLYE